jgi:hypothetical protein
METSPLIQRCFSTATKPTFVGADSSFADSIASGEEFEARYANPADRIAALNFISGFCYTQLTDNLQP